MMPGRNRYNWHMSRASKSSLTQLAYERLRADLLACRLAPGERLNINDLCEALGVSLSAVREALSRLTSDGLVVAEPQRGFRVTPISPEDLQDLTKARIEIEGLCLKRAIEVGDIKWESSVVAAYHSLSRVPECAPGDEQRLSDDWVQAHAAYHRALVSACDSPWLLRMRELLYSQAERYRRLSLPLARNKRDVGREHREIRDAVLARDFDHALALVRAHLQLTARILTADATWQS
jgi:DNA-binding GntR family transcriptional regulator